MMFINLVSERDLYLHESGSYNPGAIWFLAPAGKILMDLCGKPVLQRVIERVRRSKYVNRGYLLVDLYWP